MGGAGGNIPVIADLTHEFIFDQNLPIFTDKINGVQTLKRDYNVGDSSIGDYGLICGWVYGVCLNVEAKEKDYIEFYVKYGQNYTQGTEGTYHLRILNLGRNSAGHGLINDVNAFLIYRGTSYLYWTRYFNQWYTLVISEDYELFNEQKVGIFLETLNSFKLYIKDILIGTFNANWTANFPNDTLYSFGVTTKNYTRGTDIQIKSCRIYRNGVLK